MDIFPSELLERLEVIKSLTPEMEGDAIGGTMNLQMKDAPGKELLQINTGIGFSNYFNKNNPYQEFVKNAINKKSPGEIYGSTHAATVNDFQRRSLTFSPIHTPINGIFGITYGNRVGKNKKFGYIFSGSYQNNYRGANSFFLQPNFIPSNNNTVTFADMFLRKYSTQSKRLGLNAKLDYKINSNNKITLYNLYLRMDELQTRKAIDSVLSIQRNGPGTGSIMYPDRTTWQIQQIENHTLHGEHSIRQNFKIDWNGVYSNAKNAIPDQAQYSIQHSLFPNDKTGIIEPKPYNSPTMNHLWRRNTDRDIAGYLNFTYYSLLFGRKSEYKIGGLYRDKQRNSYYNEYGFKDTAGQPMSLDYIPATSALVTISNPLGSPIDANNYTVHEKVAAGYVQGKVNLTDRLELLGGLRVEYTNDHYETNAAVNYEGRYGTISYKDALPSAQLKYLINNNQSLRFSYYRAISRPGYFEFIPYIVNGDNYDEGGNIHLKRTRSSNFDGRYEWLFGTNNQLLIGGFYKNIQDPIEYSLTKNPKAPLQNMLAPVNFGNATNFGFEVVLTKYFGDFGFTANYTFTNSKITTDKLLMEGGSQTGVSQTRPLQGQAKHIGNLSLLYKNPHIGLDAQLAYVYTGERLAQVSPFYGLDYWQKPLETLDFSIEKNIGQHFSVYAKANNLTNSAYHLFLKSSYKNWSALAHDSLSNQSDDNEITTQLDRYKQTFLFGMRYKL